MAKLGGHPDLDQTLNLDQDNQCQSTGDPQLDQAVRQWLSWDKVNGCCELATPNVTSLFDVILQTRRPHYQRKLGQLVPVVTFN